MSIARRISGCVRGTHEVASSPAVLIVALVGLAAGAGGMGCGTVLPPVHRGNDRATIHAAVVAAATEDGYRCAPSPDLSWQSCRHADAADLGFAYLPVSNLLQLWSIFSRDDPGLHPRWRTGSCAGVDAEVGRINAETIVKIVCEERTLRFEMTTWIPSRGLGDDDLRAWFAVFRDILAETIVGRGFLPEVGPAGVVGPVVTSVAVPIAVPIAVPVAVPVAWRAPAAGPAAVGVVGVERDER
jgi:hypothetical protein